MIKKHINIILQGINNDLTVRSRRGGKIEFKNPSSRSMLTGKILMWTEREGI